MKVNWKRGNDSISYDRPSTWFSLGTRGSGKSSFLEHVAENYLERGNGVFDLFGSRDGESLAWLRSPHVKDKKILLLKGENLDVQCSFPVKSAESVTVQDFEANDIIISSSPLYLGMDQEFALAAKLTDTLYKRLFHDKLIFLVCREAANFYYSRLKVSDSQLYAKAQMTYLIREARHMGIALGLDSIRFYAIDIDIRSLSDYLILKSQGVQGLSKDLKWLYKYVNPSLMRYMKPQQFIMLTNRGSIGYGIFPEIPWHKRERENILSDVGIKVTYGEVLRESESEGTFRTVSDKEHVEMVRLFIEENLGFVKMGLRVNRSSATTQKHVNIHNALVRGSGFCTSCRRANGKYYDKVAERGQVMP
jgi:hypothetical protein